MCRIAGFWDFNYHQNYSLNSVIEKMRNTMIYGGPDNGKDFVDKKNSLALGHRRLSIIDLSKNADQPMVSDNKVISYNGEIYNFKEIRKELIDFGIKFNTNSDTEVVLKSYQKWGKDCVHKFRGMWAFAIWDKENRNLVLCRDRVGVKPLYWYYKNGLFLFSSELKSFHKHPKFKKEIDNNALPYFFQYGYIPTPLSIFKNTHKLEAGNFLTLDGSGKITKERYWNVEDFFLQGFEDKKEWLKKDENEVAKELEDILTESFKLRMVSDVPVGMFLSGGIDSSLLTALLQKEHPTTPLKTFTIGFNEKKYNEANFAKKIARHLKTDHTELYCTPKDAFDIIPKLPDLYDEPFGDSSAIPTHLVSILAKKSVKVSLSADGADEQFCGYARYYSAIKAHKLLKNIPKPIKSSAQYFGNFLYSPAEILHQILPRKFQVTNFQSKYLKLINSLSCDKPIDILDISSSHWQQNEISFLLKNGVSKSLYENKILEEKYSNDNPLSLFMALDIKTYLMDDILTKVDRATMGISLEGREPFLDHKILEFSSQMPDEFKYKNGISKYILKKILYKYLPKKLIDRPKQGFVIPIHKWFKNELSNMYEEYLSEKKLNEAGIFNTQFVRKNLKLYNSGKNINSSKLWLIFVYQKWLEMWM